MLKDLRRHCFWCETTTVHLVDDLAATVARPSARTTPRIIHFATVERETFAGLLVFDESRWTGTLVARVYGQ
jgi:hypothetical protein